MNEVEAWWQSLTEKQQIRIWRTHGWQHSFQDFVRSTYHKRLAYNKIFLSIRSNDSKTRLN